MLIISNQVLLSRVIIEMNIVDAIKLNPVVNMRIQLLQEAPSKPKHSFLCCSAQLITHHTTRYANPRILSRLHHVIRNETFSLQITSLCQSIFGSLGQTKKPTLSSIMGFRSMNLRLPISNARSSKYAEYHEHNPKAQAKKMGQEVRIPHR